MNRVSALLIAAFTFGAHAAEVPNLGRAKLKLLESILASGNDNDPRLDREFNTLSVETKRLLRQKYNTLQPERFNERGTIVYILGRNLSSKEDWTFFKKVVTEPACLSLTDCSKRPNGETQPGDEVTLAYPALVALTQAQRVLEKNPSVYDALNIIETAKRSKSWIVSRKATTAR